ncbi:lipoprotein [Salmonella enterica subsp. enterica]|nr:lipoprotein [Salmonella enterica subsp. enterica]
MPERMALNLTAQKTPLAPADEVKFSVVGYYLYGAPANGNTLQGQLSCVRCATLSRRCLASSSAILPKRIFRAAWTKFSLRWIKADVVK